MSPGAALSGVLQGWLCLAVCLWCTLSHALGWVSRVRHMVVTGTAVCVRLCPWISSPPPTPGKQPGHSLIQCPLYCGRHGHRHSHWEEHTTLTPVC